MKRTVTVVFSLLLSAAAASAVTDRPLSPLNSAHLLQQDAGAYAFTVFGDFRPSRRDRPYPDAYRRILREMDMISPAFIVSTGDAYYGYGGTFRKFRNEIDYFLSTVKPLDAPFFNTTGNHEVAADPGRGKYLEERTGGLYGSFDFSSSHFILLNTEEKGREGAIAGEQLAWLERDLAENRDAEHIFVFMHRPMFPAEDPGLMTGKSFRDKENRDYLHGLFRKYRVRTVFAGHEHQFGEAVRDGVKYIITGGGGAPLYQAPPGGGFFHYLIVRVKGGDVVTDVVVPYALQIRTIAGNDGFEPRAEVEVTNSSPVDFPLRNVSLKMPNADAYRVKAISISNREKVSAHDAKIRKFKDNGDGTAAVSVETLIPKNGTVRVSVEAEL